jgi:hypothetical protein
MADEKTGNFSNFSINGQWLRAAQGQDDREFFNVTLPPGCKTADGRDLSFGEFTVPATNVFADQYNEKNVVVGLFNKGWDAEAGTPTAEDRQIAVKVPQIDEKTERPLRDENGIPVPAGDPVKLTAKEIADAIKAHYQQRGEFTTININGRWLREGHSKEGDNRFFNVTLPPGTTIGGGTIGLGYAEFVVGARFVHPDNFNANKVNISLPNKKWDIEAQAPSKEPNLITVKVPRLGDDGKPVRDENGAPEIISERTLTPQVIKSAVDAQKEAFRASQRQDRKGAPVTDRVQASRSADPQNKNTAENVSADKPKTEGGETKSPENNKAPTRSKSRSLDEKGARAERTSKAQRGPARAAVPKTRAATRSAQLS